MTSKQDCRVEVLLSDLHLYHLMPAQALSEPYKDMRNTSFSWLPPSLPSTNTLPIVKVKYNLPKRRRMANVHNRSFPQDMLELPNRQLITVKPDRLRRVKKLSMTFESEFTPENMQIETEQEITIPIHREFTAKRRSVPIASNKKPKSIHFAHIYRHIQLSRGVKAERLSPSQLVSDFYDPPYCKYMKGKSGSEQVKRRGYERPRTRMVSEEIQRLKDERNKRFDAIIGKVAREFELFTG
jgi:hypothetical protein